MNIFSLLERFIGGSEDGTARILVEQNLCVRLKTPMASCYICIGKCPERSIKITDTSLEILNSCINCKACIYICPNSVFYIKGSDRHRHSLRHSQEGLKPGKPAYSFCSRAAARESGIVGKIAKTVSVECIYELEDIDIISFLKRGIDLFFIKDECKACKLKYFFDRKLKKISLINEFYGGEARVSILGGDELDEESFISSYTNQNDKPEATKAACVNGDGGSENALVPEKAIAVDRREFFRNSFKEIKNKAGGLISEISVEDLPFSKLYSVYADAGTEKGSTDKARFLRLRNRLFSFLKDNQDAFPLIEMKLPYINGNCVFCSACWSLCPTGALSIKENDVVLSSFLCTGCGLCKDVCSFGAVSMRKARNIKDISKDKVLYSNKKTS